MAKDRLLDSRSLHVLFLVAVLKMRQHCAHNHYLQARLPADLYEWLRLRSFLTRQSMNSLVVEALKDYRHTAEATPVSPNENIPQ